MNLTEVFYAALRIQMTLFKKKNGVVIECACIIVLLSAKQIWIAVGIIENHLFLLASTFCNCFEYVY